MSEPTYGMIRIVGSNVWFGVDIERRELMMERDGHITIIADFRSTEAAALVDIWFKSIATKFSPARQTRRKFLGIF